MQCLKNNASTNTTSVGTSSYCISDIMITLRRLISNNNACLLLERLYNRFSQQIIV